MAYTGLDFTKPFDPSAYTVLSPTQLASLVGGLAPISGLTGLTILTTDIAGNPTVPSVATYPKLAAYLWLRIGANSATLYIWNPGGAVDPTLQNWQVANINSITAGSITGNQIAALTITDDNISSVGWSKLPSGGAVGGALTGSMPNPSLANSSVGGTNIAALSVANTQLLGSEVANQILVNAGATTAVTWITSLLAAGSATLEAGIATAKLQAVQVNAAGTGYQYSAHNVIQVVSAQSTASQSTIQYNTVATALTTGNSDLFTGFGSAGVLTFTPLSTSSTIVVEVILRISPTATAPYAVAGLYNGSAFIDFGSTNIAVGGCINLKQVIANAALTPRTFSVYIATGFSGGSGTAVTNQTLSTTPTVSLIRVTEYI